MPEDPIGTMFANMATALNQIAPHTVIPKFLAAMTPKAQTANGGDVMQKGAAMWRGAGQGGVTARQAQRAGESVDVLQQRLAADKDASNRSGYSVTGSTIFM